MNTMKNGADRLRLALLAVFCTLGESLSPRREAAAKEATKPAVQQKIFSSPKAAADALISAAARFDVPALTEILGPDGVDLVVSEDPVQDKNTAGAFAQQGPREALRRGGPEERGTA